MLDRPSAAPVEGVDPRGRAECRARSASGGMTWVRIVAAGQVHRALLQSRSKRSESA